MSTPAVTSASLHQQLEVFFHTRQSDLGKLGKSLQSGDMAGAQQAYNAIVALGQNGPFKNGDPFKVSQREQDFNAIGQALQSGDLAGAQHAFAALKETFMRQRDPVNPAVPAPAVSAPAQGSGFSVKA